MAFPKDEVSISLWNMKLCAQNSEVFVFIVLLLSSYVCFWSLSSAAEDGDWLFPEQKEASGPWGTCPTPIPIDSVSCF